jgi:acyl-CoA thioesterase
VAWSNLHFPDLCCPCKYLPCYFQYFATPGRDHCQFSFQVHLLSPSCNDFCGRLVTGQERKIIFSSSHAPKSHSLSLRHMSMPPGGSFELLRPNPTYCELVIQTIGSSCMFISGTGTDHNSDPAAKCLRIDQVMRIHDGIKQTHSESSSEYYALLRIRKTRPLRRI